MVEKCGNNQRGSFYEYCKLLDIEEPELPEHLKLTQLVHKNKAELGDLMDRFTPLQNHFNRYLMIGGFPELVLSDDDVYAQRMLREDVVDKVIKRDVLTLFNIGSPLLMEKLFLYLCMNSTEIFNVTTATKELENVSVSTIDNYIEALEMSNLIYLAKPMNVGSKGALKGKPKIFIADAAIRNAVLMSDDVLSDEKELGAMVETAVYKHMVSFYQGTAAQIGYFRKAKDNQKEVDENFMQTGQMNIGSTVKELESSGMTFSLNDIVVDNDGNIGIAGGDAVLLFDSDYNLIKTIEKTNYIKSYDKLMTTK